MPDKEHICIEGRLEKMGKVKHISFLLARILLAGIFVYASIHKIVHPDEFYVVIMNYQILPQYGAYALAYLLPVLEMSVGLALLSRKFLYPSLVIVSGMLLIFISAIASAWLRGLDISCGCFGEGNSGEYFEVIVRDIFLLLLCMIIFLLNPRRKLD